MDVLNYIVELFLLIATKLVLVLTHTLSLFGEIFLLTKEYFFTSPKTFHSILITGASSGMGRELALEYAAQKNTRLVLISRRIEELKQVKKECELIGAKQVDIYSADVRNKEQMEKIILESDDKQELDLVFANAGIFPDFKDKLTESSYLAFDINAIGVLHTILPILSRFTQRRRGHIAIHSSIAAFVPQPTMPMYCASKAAALSIGENLRGILTSYNVGCTVICPGWFQSHMMDHVKHHKLPLFDLMDTHDAVVKITRALKYNRAIYCFNYLSSLLGYATRSHTPLWKQHVIDTNLAEVIKGWKDKVSLKQLVE